MASLTIAFFALALFSTMAALPQMASASFCGSVTPITEYWAHFEGVCYIQLMLTTGGPAAYKCGYTNIIPGSGPHSVTGNSFINQTSVSSGQNIQRDFMWTQVDENLQPIADHIHGSPLAQVITGSNPAFLSFRSIIANHGKDYFLISCPPNSLVCNGALLCTRERNPRNQNHIDHMLNEAVKQGFDVTNMKPVSQVDCPAAN